LASVTAFALDATHGRQTPGGAALCVHSSLQLVIQQQFAVGDLHYVNPVRLVVGSVRLEARFGRAQCVYA
jgi:hypothetical protein